MAGEKVGRAATAPIGGWFVEPREEFAVVLARWEEALLRERIQTALQNCAVDDG